MGCRVSGFVLIGLGLNPPNPEPSVLQGVLFNHVAGNPSSTQGVELCEQARECLDTACDILQRRLGDSWYLLTNYNRAYNCT